MTKLVVFLGAGGSAHALKIIEGENWEEIILVTTKPTPFSCTKHHRFVVLDEEWSVTQMINTIKEGLRGEWGEVGLNFVSGTGKEHMALIAGVMHAGLSFRLVAVTKEGIKEL